MPHPVRDEEIREWAGRLTGADPLVRQEAERALRTEFPRLLRAVVNARNELLSAEDLAETTPATMAMGGCCVCLFGNVFVLPWLAFASGGAAGPRFWLTLAALVLIECAAMKGLADRQRRGNPRLLQKVEAARQRLHFLRLLYEKADDRIYLEPLMDQMVTNRADNLYLRTAADPLWPVLVRLLPLATAEDAPLINQKHGFQVSQILSIEEARAREEVVIAFFQAVGRLGNRPYLDRVRYTAEGPATSPQGLRVREAARKALTEMEARLEVERMSETMLRAAGAPAEEGRLLRPASSLETDPASLLRSAEVDGDSQQPRRAV